MGRFLLSLAGAVLFLFLVGYAELTNHRHLHDPSWAVISSTSSPQKAIYHSIASDDGIRDEYIVHFKQGYGLVS
jgi:hypothetical protein